MLPSDAPANVRPVARTSNSSQTEQLHAAFCRTGLPFRGQKTAWTRVAGDASVSLEPASEELNIPAGSILRLLLLHICTSAASSGNTAVDFGNSAEDLAVRLGRPTKAAEISEQLERLLATRVLIGTSSRTPIALFDTRGRPRAKGKWPSTVKLTARFVESLRANAVVLDSAMAGQLTQSPAVFDAYVAVRAALAPIEAIGRASISWDDVIHASGLAAGGLPGFLRILKGNLDILRNAGIEIPISMNDDCLHLEASHDRASKPSAADRSPVEVTAPPFPSQEPEPAVPEDSAPSEGTSTEANREPPTPLAPPEQPRKPGPTRALPDAPVPETLRISRELTGLSSVVWIRRGYGTDGPLIGLTPTDRFDPNQLALLMVEPVIMLLQGSIDGQSIDRASIWITANRDLIDDIWLGRVASFSEVTQRLKKVGASPWRT